MSKWIRYKTTAKFICETTTVFQGGMAGGVYSNSVTTRCALFVEGKSSFHIKDLWVTLFVKRRSQTECQVQIGATFESLSQNRFRLPLSYHDNPIQLYGDLRRQGTKCRFLVGFFFLCVLLLLLV